MAVNIFENGLYLCNDGMIFQNLLIYRFAQSLMVQELLYSGLNPKKRIEKSYLFQNLGANSKSLLKVGKLFFQLAQLNAWHVM